jgi:uncharacterized protein YjbI with pentapeptide repeats
MHLFDSNAKLLMEIPDDWEPIFADRDLLVGAQLPGAQLRGHDLGNANLSHVCLVGADLYRAFLNCPAGRSESYGSELNQHQSRGRGL